jgi:hypothetical protein
VPKKAPQVTAARRYLKDCVGEWKINENMVNKKSISNQMEFKFTYEDHLEKNPYRKSCGI